MLTPQYQRTYIHIGNSADQYRDDGGSDGSGAILATEMRNGGYDNDGGNKTSPCPTHRNVVYNIDPWIGAACAT